MGLGLKKPTLQELTCTWKGVFEVGLAFGHQWHVNVALEPSSNFTLDSSRLSFTGRSLRSEDTGFPADASLTKSCWLRLPPPGSSATPDACHGCRRIGSSSLARASALRLAEAAARGNPCINSWLRNFFEGEMRPFTVCQCLESIPPITEYNFLPVHIKSRRINHFSSHCRTSHLSWLLKVA